MLAAEYDTLPKPMRDAVIGFFDDNEAWLTGVLEQGRGKGALSLTGSAGDAAQMIVSGLEGAMLVARPYGDVARFQDVEVGRGLRLVARASSTSPSSWFDERRLKCSLESHVGAQTSPRTESS